MHLIKFKLNDDEYFGLKELMAICSAKTYREFVQKLVEENKKEGK